MGMTRIWSCGFPRSLVLRAGEGLAEEFSEEGGEAGGACSLFFLVVTSHRILSHDLAARRGNELQATRRYDFSARYPAAPASPPHATAYRPHVPSPVSAHAPTIISSSLATREKRNERTSVRASGSTAPLRRIFVTVPSAGIQASETNADESRASSRVGSRMADLELGAGRRACVRGVSKARKEGQRRGMGTNS